MNKWNVRYIQTTTFLCLKFVVLQSLWNKHHKFNSILSIGKIVCPLKVEVESIEGIKETWVPQQPQQNLTFSQQAKVLAHPNSKKKKKKKCQEPNNSTSHHLMVFLIETSRIKILQPITIEKKKKKKKYHTSNTKN